MITRISISALVTSLIVSVSFGQMKYSRTRSASPTPTPTPTAAPTPQQKIAPKSAQMQGKPSPTLPPKFGPAQNQPLIPARKGAPAPTPATSPTLQRVMASPTPSKPTSSQRTAAMQIQPQPTPAPIPVKPTPTPVPPPDIKTYVDRLIEKSKDKKFHMTVNGRDLALTPFHVWMQKSSGPNTTSTIVSMRSDEGRVYDVEFGTTGTQVTSIGIRHVNGE